MKYLDYAGLSYLWSKLKAYFVSKEENTISNIVPLYSKEYDYTCAASSNNEGFIFFGNVIPTSEDVGENWYIKFKLYVNLTSTNSNYSPNNKYCKGMYDCYVGASGSSNVYHYFNRFYSTSYRPIYHHLIANYSTTTENGTSVSWTAKYANRATNPVKIGARIQSAYGDTQPRHYKIEVYEVHNCTFSFPDNIEKYGSFYTTAKYGNCAAVSAEQGLQENGDANDTSTVYLTYTPMKAGAAGIKQYSLFMQDKDGNWQSFFTNAGGAGTSKTVNTAQFRLGSRIYRTSRSTDLSANSYFGTSQIYAYGTLADFRYSFPNITANSLGNGLTFGKPLYVLGSLDNEGYFRLDTTKYWTQDEPTSEDGKIYIRVCEAVYSDYNQSSMPTGNYRGDLISDGYAYWYKNGKFQRYYEGVKDLQNVVAKLAPLVIEVNDTDTTVPAGTYASITAALAEGREVMVKLYWSTDDNQFIYLPLTEDYTEIDYSYYFHSLSDGLSLHYCVINSNDTVSHEAKLFSFEGHPHGNITYYGTLQTTDITIANGDKLVVTDASDSNKVARASLAFDGSTTTKALSKKGTWEDFVVPSTLDKYNIDYSKQYLTIVSLEDNNTIGWKASNSSLTETISVSIDNGKTWTEKTSTTSGETLATLNTGNKLLIKGTNIAYANSSNYNYFTSTENFDVEGNIMSIISGDSFIGQVTLSTNYTFKYLFKDCTNLVNTKNLILPVTTVTTQCYMGMFHGCTSLITAPELPATTLGNHCYMYMFYNCTSLTIAPKLSATTLKQNCYNSMFYGCTALKITPELPATTLTDHCYASMFYNCSSLVAAPELPATTLEKYCYYSMFQNCTSLTIAPKLYATTLANNCYYNMFNGCTSLNYIECFATDISASYCTNSWVSNVASSGIFIKANNMSDWTTGNSGIPSGWTVYTEDEYKEVRHYELANELDKYDLNIDYSKQYLTCVALENGTISFNIWKSIGTEYITSISYSTDNGNTWTTTNNVNNKADHLSITVNVNEGDKVLWKGDAIETGYYDYDDYDDYVGSFFSSTAEFDVQGNVMSLVYGDDFQGVNRLDYEGQFSCLFCDYDYDNECKVVNARNLSLPTTTNNGCYSSMFRACTSLTTAPELPATTLAIYCYSNMFRGCTSLITAPELPATTLTENCYDGMFDGCTSLTTAPELPATTLNESCYHSMFEGCTSLITAPELPATTLAIYCYCYMFYGCTSLITAPELSAITLVDGCYNGMFYGCTSLNSIICLATDISATNCTTDWVNNVAASGSFVKADSMNDWTNGVNGIPSGWNVYTESEYELVHKYELTSYLQTETDPTVPSWVKSDIVLRNSSLPTTHDGYLRLSNFGITYTGAGNSEANLHLVTDGNTTISGILSTDGAGYSMSDSWNGTSPYIITNLVARQYLAPLASPALTGTPTAPTATAGTNTTQIATTAFVKTAIDNKVHYIANLQSGTAANYITEPEVKTVKINGSTTNSASSSNCVLQFDTTNKCLKFVFN